MQIMAKVFVVKGGNITLHINMTIRLDNSFSVDFAIAERNTLVDSETRESESNLCLRQRLITTNYFLNSLESLGTF